MGAAARSQAEKPRSSDAVFGKAWWASYWDLSKKLKHAFR